MANRPLRQFYDHDRDFGLPLSADDVVEPWRRHRHRFVESLRTLDDDDWLGATRCDEWNAQEMIHHLVTADGFFTFTLTSARAAEPTSFLRDFDPTTSPGEAALGLGPLTPGETLAAFESSTAAFIEAVDALDADGWTQIAESPLGHVPAVMSLAHGAWDSMIHERDIFVPRGRAPELFDDEIWLSTVYSLWAAAIQGGLIGDEHAVAPGPDTPIDITLGFDDVADRSIRVRVGETVSIEPLEGVGDAVAAGSALALVEGFTGRQDIGSVALPDDLLDHLTRAAQIL